jgi:hypothetical protein
MAVPVVALKQHPQQHVQARQPQQMQQGAPQQRQQLRDLQQLQQVKQERQQQLLYIASDMVRLQATTAAMQLPLLHLMHHGLLR